VETSVDDDDDDDDDKGLKDAFADSPEVNWFCQMASRNSK